MKASPHGQPCRRPRLFTQAGAAPTLSITVYTTSIRKFPLSIEFDAESVQLIQAENESLREEVDRHRRNVAKLVDMLTVVTGERDQLRDDIAANGKTSLVMRVGEMSSLSQNNLQLYQQNKHLQNLVAELAKQRDQAPPF